MTNLQANKELIARKESALENVKNEMKTLKEAREKSQYSCYNIDQAIFNLGIYQEELEYEFKMLKPLSLQDIFIPDYGEEYYKFNAELEMKEWAYQRLEEDFINIKNKNCFKTEKECIETIEKIKNIL